MPTVSVIIPTYNGEQNIDQAVQSVLSQDYSDYEILIGDDCSSDQTPDKLDHLESEYSHITTYHRDSNLGVPENMNRLVAKSSGDFLFFLDQDDYWLPEKIKRHVSRHEESNSSVVFSNYIRVDKGGRELDIASPPAFDSSGVSLVKQLYEHGNFIGTFSAVSVRRSAWEGNGGLDEQLNVSADFDLWVRLADSHEFSHIDDELAAKRNYEGNYSNNYDLLHNDNKIILSKALRIYPELREEEDRIRSRLAYQHANAAFRDENYRESISQGVHSLRLRMSTNCFVIVLLSLLDLYSFDLALGTRMYTLYRRIVD